MLRFQKEKAEEALKALAITFFVSGVYYAF